MKQSADLSRFHSLAKRLVAVPKAEVDKQKAAAVKKPASTKKSTAWG